MTYPPPAGQPDPYQPQQPYGQPPPDPTVAYPQTPYVPPSSGPPAFVPPPSGPPAFVPPPSGPPAFVPPSSGPPASGPPAFGSSPAGDPYAQPYGASQPYGAQPYGAGAQPYGAPQHFGPGYGAAAGTNTMAILALIFSFIFPPLAIVFGHLAKRQIRSTGEQGGGLATAGLWLGYLFTSLSVFFCGLVIVLGLVGTATATTT